MEKEIIVVCDPHEYDREDILQMLTKARVLGDHAGLCVSALCVGFRSEEKIPALFRYGADRVVFCQEDEPFDQAYFTEVIAEMILKIEPHIVLFPSSADGKATAAVISTRFEAGLTADCIEIDFDESGELGFSRAAINDSVIATIKCINCDIFMATVKKDVFVKKEYLKSSKGILEEFHYTGTKPRCSDTWRILEQIPKEIPKEIDIHQFNKVFCIGRGVKNSKLYERISGIAARYGFGVVGTRAAVEEDLIEKARQVGQSGKNISPQIYIGLGVSGASQHIVGLKNAGIIIAVNADKNAAIFDYADYAVLDDLETIVGCLEKEMQG